MAVVRSCRLVPAPVMSGVAAGHMIESEVSVKRFSVDCGTLWVCRCCMLEHANGECCPDDEHGGDGVAPWSVIDDRFRVYMGLSRDEHADGCDPDDECDCERREFVQSSCDGCGSRLHGARFAFGMTRERQKFSTGVLPA